VGRSEAIRTAFFMSILAFPFAVHSDPISKHFQGIINIRSEVSAMRSLARESRLKFPASNVVPYWLLCYWRLVKLETRGDFAKAWEMLPDHLPNWSFCPTVEQLAVALVDHELAERRT